MHITRRRTIVEAVVVVCVALILAMVAAFALPVRDCPEYPCCGHAKILYCKTCDDDGTQTVWEWIRGNPERRRFD